MLDLLIQIVVALPVTVALLWPVTSFVTRNTDPQP